MRRLFLIFILILALLLPGFAAAEDTQISLPALPAVLVLPEGVYSPVLTPDNLKDNGPFILSRGGTVEEWQAEFKNKGILLKAYDDKNQRLLVVTGLQDEEGQRFGDIDLQSADTRAQYRSLYQKDGPFANQGYRVESAEWKNFKHVGRFLMIKYNLREGGELVHRGFARRTVKNGLSIMLDMQVFGRKLKAGDNTALNRVFDTLSFTGNVGEGQSMPVFLNEVTTAPAETNKPSFTMSGMTRSGAKLTATVLSFSSSTPSNFTAEADAKGHYSLPIQLSGEGVYMLTLMVEAEGLEPLEKTYSINYGKGLLPVTFTSQLPETLTGDKYTISGVTEPGTKVQLIVNDKNTTKRASGKGAFSFPIATKADGAYTVRLSFEKAGFDARIFNFTAVRGSAAETVVASVQTDPAQGAAAAEASGQALSPSYTDLVANADDYDGKLLTYDGFVTGTQQQGGEWEISLALRKGASGYADTVLAVDDQDPGFAEGSRVRVYGILEGLGAAAEGAEYTYPRLRVQNITLLENAPAEEAAADPAATAAP